MIKSKTLRNIDNYIGFVKYSNDEKNIFDEWNKGCLEHPETCSDLCLTSLRSLRGVKYFTTFFDAMERTYMVSRVQIRGADHKTCESCTFLHRGGSDFCDFVIIYYFSFCVTKFFYIDLDYKKSFSFND